MTEVESVLGTGHEPVLILIPARGGSKGIPRKNLQLVDGVSLVGRAILHAHRFVRESGLRNVRVVVDTDDDEIAREGRCWGAEVPFLRPPAFSGDDTTTATSTLHLLDRLGSATWTPKSLVLLQPTSPLRSWREVLACWQVYKTSPPFAVVAVSAAHKPPQLALRATADGMLDWLGDEPPPNVRRQELTPSVYVTGSVYVIDTATFRRERRFVLPGHTKGVTVGDVGSLDVDSPADLLMAQRLALFTSGAQPRFEFLLRILESDQHGVTVASDDLHTRALRLPVFNQDALAEVARQLPFYRFPAVVLRPILGGPGPATWRSFLGCPIGMLTDPTRNKWLPLAAISADFLAVPTTAAAAIAPLVGAAATFLADAFAMRTEG